MKISKINKINNDFVKTLANDELVELAKTIELKIYEIDDLIERGKTNPIMEMHRDRLSQTYNVLQREIFGRGIAESQNLDIPSEGIEFSESDEPLFI